ncbi:wound-responsive family protein [Striga asiatica]|uniref:Wound-responsive family protein n=1 Tax=Striga asiatica TaxID=4170 RepID=A0A5A7QYV0_STRAF|nr:wound-responsive family protein [Striga asiatica]
MRKNKQKNTEFIVDSGGAGGPQLIPGPKPTSSFESSGHRLRFTVELRPGETTIVSWKKLLKEASSSKRNGLSASASCPLSEVHRQKVSHPPPPPPPAVASSKQLVDNEVEESQAQAGPNCLSNGNGSSEEEDVFLDDVPDDDEYDTDDSFIDDVELDDYFQVDNSAVKHGGFFVNRGKLERIEPATTTNQQPKKRRLKTQPKVKVGIQIESQSGKELNNADELDRTLQRKEKGEIVGRFDLNVPPSASISSEPQITQASYGKVPMDVINCLMSIVGHLMQLRTLKLVFSQRNLKIMANLGLSAKQEKDDRLQKIKQEVADMRLEEDSGLYEDVISILLSLLFALD